MSKAAEKCYAKTDKWFGRVKETVDSTARDIGDTDEIDYDTASSSQIERMAEQLSYVSVQYKKEARQIEEERVDEH